MAAATAAANKAHNFNHSFQSCKKTVEIMGLTTPNLFCHEDADEDEDAVENQHATLPANAIPSVCFNFHPETTQSNQSSDIGHIVHMTS